jgi:hypothetical protein
LDVKKTLTDFQAFLSVVCTVVMVHTHGPLGQKGGNKVGKEKNKGREQEA